MVNGTSARYNAHRRQRKVHRNVKYKLRENIGVIGSKNCLKTSMLNVDGLSDVSLADVQDFVERSS